MARRSTEKLIHLLVTAQVVVGVAILAMLIVGVFVLNAVTHRTTESVVLSDIHRDSMVIGDRLQGWVGGEGFFLFEPLDIAEPAQDIRLGTDALRTFGTGDQAKADEIEQWLDLTLAAAERMTAADDPTAIYAQEVMALQQTLANVALQYQLAEMAEMEASMGLVEATERILLFLGPLLVILAFLTVPALTKLRARADRAELAEDLVRSKDDFLARISHEIRTPLTGILGLSEVLRDEGLEHNEASELVSTIADQSAELAGIVEDLLVASVADIKELPVRLVEVDLHASVVASVASFMEGESVVIGAAGGWAVADPARVRQVLRNLISNAFRHGGEHISVDVRPADGFADVVVMDDGPALAADTIDGLFEPYATPIGRRESPGAVGIGLSISRDLARRMGGDLTYRHTGTHSEFVLTLAAASDRRSGDVESHVDQDAA